jgi:excinuclease ABC subunit C
MGADTSNSKFDAKAFLLGVSSSPGVYRMLNAKGEVIYVGKARNLKNRLSSYFRGDPGAIKVRAIVSQTRSVDITFTHTEGDALILESNLIKELRPRYNVVLRDDKSYPYIFISDQDQFPRLAFHRGARNAPGQYYGPYPSAGAVRQTLQLLQKLFKVRQCEDSFFANRSRPCLQYQIKRCAAPCVGLVGPEDYRQDVAYTKLFLEGKDNQIIDALVKRMEQSSAALAFEEAARYRDQIAYIQKVKEHQYMSTERGNLDIVACRMRSGQCCVQIFFVREGRNLGNKALFPRVPKDATESDVLNAVLTQYYLGHGVPRQILVSHALDDSQLLAEVLEVHSRHRVAISNVLRGERARWMEMAKSNAEIALAAHLSSRAGMAQRIESLRELLGLEDLPKRMECFDISHTQGEATVASCVVFDSEGAVKREYRRYNIENITPGDDYGAMGQALSRRYTRLLKEGRPIPDLVFVDGGAGQLAMAEQVLEQLQLSGPRLVGVAKGPERKPGLESLLVSGRAQPINPRSDSPALHLIQQIRDESHRFALLGHRSRRARKRNRSELEDIAGLGPKRRQQLLKHFGGIQGVRKAGVEDLTQVAGISKQMAQIIYRIFHGNVAEIG